MAYIFLFGGYMAYLIFLLSIVFSSSMVYGSSTGATGATGISSPPHWTELNPAWENIPHEYLREHRAVVSQGHWYLPGPMTHHPYCPCKS
jgi:hypothetical protein